MGYYTSISYTGTISQDCIMGIKYFLVMNSSPRFGIEPVTSCHKGRQITNYTKKRWAHNQSKYTYKLRLLDARLSELAGEVLLVVVVIEGNQSRGFS